MENNIKKVIDKFKIGLYNNSAEFIRIFIENKLGNESTEEIIKCFIDGKVDFKYGNEFNKIIRRVNDYKFSLEHDDVRVNDLFNSFVSLTTVHFKAKLMWLTVFEYLVIISIMDYVYKKDSTMLKIMIKDYGVSKELMEKCVGKKIIFKN